MIGRRKLGRKRKWRKKEGRKEEMEQVKECKNWQKERKTKGRQIEKNEKKARRE